MKTVCCPALSALLLCTLTVAPALADTIRVPEDQSTIQAAIHAASAEDFVVVAPGTYVENLYILGKRITLRSEKGAATTVIDGNRSGSVVILSGGEADLTVLEGFTIRNGTGTDRGPDLGTCGGGVFCSAVSPTILDCRIIENRADMGGGIGCVQEATPTIAGTTIADNQAAFHGGGIYADFLTTLAIMSCTISNNDGHYFGGGFYLYGASVSAANCIVVGNLADNGGGFYTGYHTSLKVTFGTISENSAIGIDGTGGGVYADRESSAVLISNSIVWGNSASLFGSPYGKEIFGIVLVGSSVVQGGVARPRQPRFGPSFRRGRGFSSLPSVTLHRRRSPELAFFR